MSTKQFLYAFFGVATAIWLGIYLAFGPAGLSEEYMAEYGAEHDHYLEVIKSEAYKRYEERPELYGPGSEHAPANLEELIAFVERYEARPELHAEEARRARFAYAFEFFNALLVVVLIIRFAKAPLLRFLDAGVEEERERIETAAARRADAEAREAAANKQLAQLPSEEARVGEETEHRLWNELAELEKANQHSLSEMVKAMEDRKAAELVAAERRMKQELIDAGIAAFTERFQRSADDETQAALVEAFAKRVSEIKA